jgi:hypothetical protein
MSLRPETPGLSQKLLTSLKQLVEKQNSQGGRID